MNMKFKSIVSACMLLFAFWASNAKASDCTVQAPTFVEVGQYFSYSVYMPRYLFPGPHPPGQNEALDNLSISFYGTGISPTGPGEAYPGTYAAGYTHNLSGFYNPGGIAGTYERYAVVRWPLGHEYCTTAPIYVTLQ